MRCLRADDRQRPTRQGRAALVQAEVQGLLTGGEPFPRSDLQGLELPVVVG